MITNDIQAAVAVVVILAFFWTNSDSDLYSKATTIMRYMITPNTAASTQHIWKVAYHLMSTPNYQAWLFAVYSCICKPAVNKRETYHKKYNGTGTPFAWYLAP